MVDIEIVDTRNDNESQLVTAGEASCSCNSPERAELADASHFAGSGPKAAPPSPRRGEMRRVASAGALTGGLRRAGSAHTLRRPPSSGRLYDGGNHPTHSRNSGGSDLFDALLMAATGEHEGGGGRSHGEPPVSSHQRPARATRPSVRAWGMVGSHDNLQDSLQNAMDALRGAAGDEDYELGLARLGSTGRNSNRRMLRRNSVSMIIENPVLAQTGAGDSLIMGHPYFAPYAAMGGDGTDREHSVHSGEGDTDRGEEGEEAEGRVNDEQDPSSVRRNQLRHFHKQSSAVNLNRLGAGAAGEIRRLQDEMRKLREERRTLELSLEESKSAQKEAERSADEANAACRHAANIIERLKQLLAESNISIPKEEDSSVNGVLKTSEQEIELLKAELGDTKAEAAKLQAEKKELDSKLKAATASIASVAGLFASGMPGGQALPNPFTNGGGANLPPPTTTAAAPGARGSSMPPPPLGALQMPYAAMFGSMPPLNPYGGMQRPGHGAAAAAGGGGSMQKVASMPAMLASPPSASAQYDGTLAGGIKRKAEEDVDPLHAVEEDQCKRRATTARDHADDVVHKGILAEEDEGIALEQHGSSVLEAAAVAAAAATMS